LSPAARLRVPLQGIVPPLVTPFEADGSLDTRAFEASFEAYEAAGVSGYLVLGSNGEAASLDEPEKLELVRLARRAAGGRLLLAGTGLESTRGTIALTCRAADLGADAALLLTPAYYKARMSEEVLRRHFETVADASPIPVLAYSAPAFTGLAWPPGLGAALAAHPRIVGMKDSSGDLGLMGRTLSEVPPSFAVACGSAPVIYPALCLGAAAGIVAVACCAPRQVVALYRAFRSGDHTRALTLQRALSPLASAVTAGHGVPGLKAAMQLAGLRGGEPRAPLQPLPAAEREQLRALLAHAEQA
jgi:4-hydroxy-2-oxoglutarate aldolase